MHESLSYVQGIMCINSFPSNDIACSFLSSTNDVLEGCDNASISVDSKLVSEGEKETSEDLIEIPNLFGLALHDDESSFSRIDGVEFIAPRKKKTKKRKRVPKKKKEKLKFNKFDRVFVIQDNESHNVILPKLGNDSTLSPLWTRWFSLTLHDLEVHY